MTDQQPHHLTFAAERMGVHVEARCPYAGQQFDSIADAPACRVVDEDGMPGAGPYLDDDCAVVRSVEDLGTDVLNIPKGERVPLTGGLMPVSWHVERPYPQSGRELWVTPTALADAEATETTP